MRAFHAGCSNPLRFALFRIIPAFDAPVSTPKLYGSALAPSFGDADSCRVVVGKEFMGAINARTGEEKQPITLHGLAPRRRDK